MGKNRIPSVWLIVFGLLLSLGCAKPQRFRLGYLGALTGKSHIMGISGRNGVELAIHDFSLEHKIKIQLVVSDNAGDPARIREGINNLIQADVRLIIGPLTSNMARPVINAIAGQPVLVVSPSIATDEVSGVDDNFLRMAMPAGRQGEKLAELIGKDGYKRVACIYDSGNSAYTLGVIRSFREAFNQGEVVWEDNLAIKSTARFARLAREVADSGVRACLLCADGLDSAAIIQQIKRISPEMAFYGSSWVNANDFLIHGGRAVEGTKIVSGYETVQKSARYLQFREHYTKHYHHPPDFVAGYAYETTMILLQVLLECGDDDPEKIKQQILTGSPFPGLEEPITIDAFGDAKRNYSVFIVKNGNFIILE